MSNIDAAMAALAAELAQAKQGLAYYQSQVSALETALSQLGALGLGAAAAKPAGAKRGRKPGKVKVEKAVKGKPGRPAKVKSGRAAKGPNELPFTGGDYWPNLVTSEPKSASDILKESIAGLSFQPSKEQIKKLSQRMTFVLNSLVKSGGIKDSGSGRGRRFFK
ncbi:MAG TPA: hypothetical protein VF472_07660 [Burkholderiaceae bacterium]